MPFTILEDPTGKAVAAKANGSGAMEVAMSGGGDASAANQTTEIARLEAIRDRLPASGALSDSELRASPVPVSAASLPLPAGAATQTTLAAIAANTQAPLGTSFERNRGTVSTTSTAFPSQSFPRGFLIRNLESVKTIYVAAGTVTTADGWPILPGETHEFDLPNSNVLQGITSALTSAYAIGAVI